MSEPAAGGGRPGRAAGSEARALADAGPPAPATILELLGAWDGIGAVVRYDEPTGTWIFIALHDDTLGRPVGGCRMKVYDRPADGLEDALRLARGMTRKWAVIDLPFGGGKSVLAVPRPLAGEERRGLFRRFGGLLDSLRGAYATGEDLGTTPEDMAFLSSVTPWVKGTEPGSDEPADPGPYTALGVFTGMQAALATATGSPELNGRSVLVQGVGDVGVPLARLIAESGGELLVSDLRADQAHRVADELGATVVDGVGPYGVECDVYAPCAVGATLNARTIPELRCRVVAGSANNQLEVPEDAERLRERGILYAPDYVINAGGAMAFGLMSRGTADRDELRRRVADIGDMLLEIFGEAARRDESPAHAAERRAERILARGPEGA